MVIYLDHSACDDSMGYTVACSFQHRRPENAMVIDDVAPNKMRDPVFTAPVTLPVFSGCFCPFFRECDITNRGIDPYIYHKVVTLRELHPPFKCTGDAPVVKFIFYPSDRIIPGICLLYTSDAADE